MRPPYRVIVWGPGNIGTTLLKEIVKKPELELVGVLAYNPDKNGKDVGEYLGMAPLGVRMTTDQEQIITTDADCVLFCPGVRTRRDVNSKATNIICRMLESGKNVIASSGWWYPHWFSPALAEKLENACGKGNSCIHGTGVNPGWLIERVVTTLTGGSTSISHIKAQEVSDISAMESADMLRGLGCGLPTTAKPLMEQAGDGVYGEALALGCAILGLKMERVESEKKYFVAKRNIQLRPIVIRKGEISGVDYRFHAIVNGERFMTLQEIWYTDPNDLPDGHRPGDYYTITIEGEPTSIKCEIEMLASAEKNLEFREGDNTSPAFYLTAVTMIQAIPIVCGAQPGIIYANSFANFVPDLRDFRSPLIIERGGGMLKRQ